MPKVGQHSIVQDLHNRYEYMMTHGREDEAQELMVAFLEKSKEHGEVVAAGIVLAWGWMYTRKHRVSGPEKPLSIPVTPSHDTDETDGETVVTSLMTPDEEPPCLRSELVEVLCRVRRTLYEFEREVFDLLMEEVFVQRVEILQDDLYTRIAKRLGYTGRGLKYTKRRVQKYVERLRRRLREIFA